MTEVCLELFLFDNALMSLLILQIGALLSRVKLRGWGVAVACAIGAVVSALAMVHPFFLSILIKIALLLVMTLLPYRIRTAKEALRCALCVLLATFLSAGLAFALCNVFESSFTGGVLFAEGSMRVLLIAAVISAFLPRIMGELLRRKRMSGYDVRLRIVTEFGESITPARVDTGNLLVEEVSKKPVIVGDPAALRQSIPAEWAAGKWMECPVSGMLLIPFKSVGGAGMMPALTVKAAYWQTDGEWRACLPCIVAISKERLRGQYGAILNADCVEMDSSAI